MNKGKVQVSKPGPGVARECRSGRRARRREGRGRTQVLRELLDKLLHRGMPEGVEAKKVHFADGLLGGPLVDRDAIGRDQGAGAIIPESAVQENLLLGILAKQGEELRHLLVARRSPPAHRNVHKAHGYSRGFAAFPVRLLRIVAPQVHNRGDAQLFQFGKPCLFWLPAAVKQVVNFSGVVDSRNAQFLPVSRFARGGIRRFGGSFFLRNSLPRKKSQEKQTEKTSLHPSIWMPLVWRQDKRCKKC